MKNQGGVWSTRLLLKKKFEGGGVGCEWSARKKSTRKKGVFLTGLYGVERQRRKRNNNCRLVCTGVGVPPPPLLVGTLPNKIVWQMGTIFSVSFQFFEKERAIFLEKDVDRYEVSFLGDEGKSEGEGDKKQGKEGEKVERGRMGTFEPSKAEASEGCGGKGCSGQLGDFLNEAFKNTFGCVCLDESHVQEGGQQPTRHGLSPPILFFDRNPNLH